MGVEANEGELVNKGLTKIDEHSSGTGGYTLYICLNTVCIFVTHSFPINV